MNSIAWVTEALGEVMNGKAGCKVRYEWEMKRWKGPHLQIASSAAKELPMCEGETCDGQAVSMDHITDQEWGCDDDCQQHCCSGP